MALPPDMRRSALARHLSTMVFSHVAPQAPMAMVRAVAWCNALERTGLQVPLFLVHDLGVLFSLPKGAGSYDVGPRTPQLARANVPPAVRPLVEAYGRLVRMVVESDVAERLAGMRLRDDVVAVLLGRVLLDVYNRWRDRPRSSRGEELPLDIGLVSDVDYAGLLGEFDQRYLWSFLEHVGTHAMNLATQVELIDLDTVRLLGMFKDGPSAGLGAGIDVVDLATALASPDAHAIANFSLDLLPSVLETPRSTGAQMFSVDGYASIERKGNVDSLVLAELAYPDEVFEQKVVDDELLYYGREREREDERRLHYILIDSSASMRGQRQVFARGLALALVKKLALRGDEVWLRFFDSRLHELVRLQRASAVPVPYVLSFSSARGRNYGRALRQLLAELGRLRHEQGRQVVVYLITHGQCHLDPEVLAQLKPLAFTYGVIVLPTGPLPDFVSSLHKLQLVDASAIATRQGRARRALDIVGDVTADVAPTRQATRTRRRSRGLTS